MRRIHPMPFKKRGSFISVAESVTDANQLAGLTTDGQGHELELKKPSRHLLNLSDIKIDLQ